MVGKNTVNKNKSDRQFLKRIQSLKAVPERDKV